MSYYHGGFKNGGVDWDYYNQFDELNDKYLPVRGEGETRATQIATACNKLVYKWYNDGDVYDNTKYMVGWCNDLSSYANWLYKYTGASDILERIFYCRTQAQYECILKDMWDFLMNKQVLEFMDKFDKVGSVYKCKGAFKFIDRDSEEDDDYYEEDEEEYDEDEE